ncbi:MAG TPA: helix-turn-helix transcriptional regulator [Firmicutes bacterium]|mgnify:CR=1 FL=1|nr:helix-turn-helix transcriptional regulator [Bacillota bacterium]
MDNNIGKRIAQIREYFNLSQESFGKVIGFKQSQISRIESGVTKPTEVTINAIISRFPVNPKWLKTGEGDMLISPEKYLQNGVNFLGKENMVIGIVNILQSPEFKDLKAQAGLYKILESGVPEEIAKYFRYIINTWNQGDEKTRHWLEKQLEIAFREVEK